MTEPEIQPRNSLGEVEPPIPDPDAGDHGDEPIEDVDQTPTDQGKEPTS